MSRDLESFGVVARISTKGRARERDVELWRELRERIEAVVRDKRFDSIDPDLDTRS
jgi:hypothetical protein